MKLAAVAILATLVGCAGDSPDDGGGDTDTADTTDTGDTSDDASDGITPDGPPAASCPLGDVADAGAKSAIKTQSCGIPMSGGMRWSRMSTAVVDAPLDVVQLELWDGEGAFAGRTVAPGTYTISGADAALATCGVCVRALGDKGTAAEKEYIATGGTVTVTSVGAGGATFAASVSDITFAEVDAEGALVSGGCDASLESVSISGTVMQVGGGGGGGGGCPTGIGD